MAESDRVATQGDSLFIVTILLLALANVFSFFRLATRASKKQLGADDYVLALATASLNVQTAFVFCSIHYGFGKHGADLTHQNHVEALRYFYLIQVMYKVVGGFTKAAFVLLYLRIFAKPRFQWFAKWIVLTSIILGTISFTFATIFQCRPLELAWNKALKGQCIDNTAFWYAHAAYHTSLDLIIFSMPIPLVWRLQMPVQKRIGLVCLFVLGFFGCIASVVRMTALLGSSKSNDPTWGSYEALLWTEVEANVSIICACLPPLRGPAMKAIRQARGKEGTSTADRSYYLQDLSATRKRRQSALEDTKADKWQFQLGKDTYAVQVQESPTRSGSEDSMVPQTIHPGIIKTTQWEILESDHLQQQDVLREPEVVHSRV